jgi:hypothetical protein
VHLLSQQHIYIQLIQATHVIHQLNGPKSVLVTLQSVVESKVQQLPQAQHQRIQLDTKLSLMY